VNTEQRVIGGRWGKSTPYRSSPSSKPGVVGSIPASPTRKSPLSPFQVFRLDEALDHMLMVAADFIDLKSPYMGGHSRRCAELSAEAGRQMGLADDAIMTAVSNSILDKRGTVTRAEFDRVDLGSRSRCVAPCGQGHDHPGDRRPPLHFTQNGGSPHSAHVQQDRRYSCRGRSLGYAKRLRALGRDRF